MNDIIENAVRSGYDFVPDKVVMGKFSYSFDNQLDKNVDYMSICAVPSCKHKHKSWCNAYKFKSLTKYSPCVQRNAVAELEKAAGNICEEIDNVPTTGFRIVSFDDNLYNWADKQHQYCGEAVIYDPRGFAIEIPRHDLAKMIAENGGTIEEYAFKNVEYVYCSSNNGMTLIPWKSKQCQDLVKKQKASTDADGKPMFISPAKLQVGHAYITADSCSIRPGIYIYAGRHDTYSPREVGEALSGEFNSGYEDHNEYCDLSSHPWNNKGEPSCKNAFVFFMAKQLKNSSDRYWRKADVFDKIAVMKSITKEFMKEVPLDSDWTMPDDASKKMDYDAIQEFMATSPYFTKIDGSRVSFEKLEKVEFKNFARLFVSDKNAFGSFADNDYGNNPDGTKKLYPYSDTFGYSESSSQYRTLLCPTGIVAQLRKKEVGFDRTPFAQYNPNKSLEEARNRTFEMTTVVNYLTLQDFCLTGSERRKYFYSNAHSTEIDSVKINPVEQFKYDTTLEEIYNTLCPLVPVLYFENGRKVGQFHTMIHLKNALIRASMFNGKDHDLTKVKNDILKAATEMR